MSVVNEGDRPTVAVIGTGDMGTALVRLAAAAGADAGRQVLWGTRDVAALASRIAAAGIPASARPVTQEAALEADILVLALWHRDALSFVRSHEPRLAGKVLVDIANPFTNDFTDYFLPETTSAAEVIAQAVPGATVVGAFKNTYAAVFDNPEFPEGLSDVLVTGDDPQAKAAVAAIFAGAPFRFLDAGALANSRTVERMTLLSRELSIRYGHRGWTSWRHLGIPTG